MDVRDAADLIAPTVVAGEHWADLGAGRGTFTVALAGLLGPKGTVYAIERDDAAIAALQALARRSGDDRAAIVVRQGDFTRPIDLPALDGVLLANALHFVDRSRQAEVLARLGGGVEQEGKVLVIEYDNRPPSRWVPFPVSLARLGDVARSAGLRAPVLIGRRRSDFGGTMYAAYMTRS